jgi:hypothetical protein
MRLPCSLGGGVTVVQQVFQPLPGGPWRSDTPSPRQGRLTATTKSEGCFYCGRKGCDFDGEHAPVPWRHGGCTVVAACLPCHKLKDGLNFVKWSPSEQQAVEDGSSSFATVFLTALCAGTIEDKTARITQKDVRIGFDACTTWAARIAVMKAVAFALDQTGGEFIEDAGAA